MRIAQFVLGVTLLAGAACASTLTYTATLNGASESPANSSLGTGTALVIIDTTLNTMEVEVTFSGLSGTTTASHIHCCTAVPDTGNAGVATITPTFTGFPLGVTSGSYDQIYDLTAASGTYNPSFVTTEGSIANAEAAMLAGIAAGDAYLNIHTTVVPGGEIRGFLGPEAAPTPEPGTFALAGMALVGLVWQQRRRRAAR